MWVDLKNDITMALMIRNNEASANYPSKLCERGNGGCKPAAAPALPQARQ
jgi:hypothetical protein